MFLKINENQQNNNKIYPKSHSFSSPLRSKGKGSFLSNSSGHGVINCLCIRDISKHILFVYSLISLTNM